MSILSSIGSAISKAVSGAVSAVSSFFGGGTSTSAPSGNATSTGLTSTGNAFGGTTSPFSGGGGGVSSGGATQTGNAPNTYNPTTGVYTNAQGQGMSTATAPIGATLVGGTSTGALTGTPAVQAQALPTASNQAIPINPTTGVPYTQAEAPYGMMGDRPATQMESGQAGTVPGFSNIGTPLVVNQGFGAFVNSYINNIKTSSNADALLLAGGITGIVKAIGVYATSAELSSIGATATTTGGAETLAASSPEAAGVISKTVPAAGEIAVNTATKTGIIKWVSGLSLGTKLTTVGGVLTLLGVTSSNVLTTDDAKSSFIKDSGELAVKLRQSGMNTEADKLYEMNKDLRNGLDNVIPYIPFFGKSIEGQKINGYVDQLNEINNQYQEQVIKDEQQKIIDERAYAEQKLQEQRRYNEAQQAEQRIYEQQKLEEQRRYNEEQQAARDEAAAATATESFPGSTLDFGLLHGGGGRALVNPPADTGQVDENGNPIPTQGASTGAQGKLTNKDAIAQYLFGKNYDELTDEQKAVVDKW